LIRDQFDNSYAALCEHIEYAGVHSGDSGMMTPPLLISNKIKQKLISISKQLANQLGVVGPVNFQFAVKNEQIYCIEANPRGSRTIPFLSKALDVDMTLLSVQAMLGDKIKTDRLPEQASYFSVKQSTFPFDRFLKDDIILGPKMRSTGETMGIDYDKNAAVLKSYLANYPLINEPGKILVSLSNNTKDSILPYIPYLAELGYKFSATPGTCKHIKALGFECDSVEKLDANHLELIDLLKDEQTRLVFNTPTLEKGSKSDGELIRNTAIQHGVPCFTLVENIKAVVESLIANKNKKLIPYALQDLNRG
jgi:carbamoyl-phosphate synthase large subunit